MIKNDVCDVTIIHTEVIEKVNKSMPEDNDLYSVSEFFKMFADFTRSKILSALTLSEMCVCDIAALLNMTHSAISHQLRLLKNARLVKNRKSGKVVYYSLDDNHIHTIMDLALSHTKEK